MPRFLIELPHEANEEACNRAIETIVSTGSHFLTHAEWGCKDDMHKCWITVEVDSREEAHIIELVRYSLEDVEEAKKNKHY